MGDEGKLYVGNLPYDIREDELRDHFEEYGNVDEVNIIMDRETGRPKGFAFVVFRNCEDAEDAIKSLNEKELQGRRVTVAKARPRGSGGGRRYDSRSSGGSRRDDYRRRYR